MALIYDSRFRVFDSNGDPLAGATLTIYDAGTTNLASIYRDAALTTPMTNPTSSADVSDAAGWFPQVFTAEGVFLDITLKDSDGATVKTYVDVPSLGSESNTFSRDFTTSRIRIRDVGGVVYIEAGNAAGDDLGGSMRLSGWAATPLDTLTIDAGATTLTGPVESPSLTIDGEAAATQAFAIAAAVAL